MPYLLENPVTRPFTLTCFTHGVLLLGIIWTALITVIIVAGVGYEYVSVDSPSFNSSGPTLWYERFAVIAFLYPKSWTCTPSKIQIGQGLPGLSL
jgi:hypothetical protein